MAITLGEALVFLTADDQPLEKTLEGAKTKTTSWAANLGSSVATLVGGAIVAAGTAAVAAITGIVVASVNVASQFDQVNRDMQTQLGLTAEEAEKLSDVARTVFGDNFTGSIEEAGQAVTDVMLTLGSAADGLADDELARLTEQAVALSDAFGIDLQESMRSASILVRTGVAKDFDDAMNIITAGFQNGLNASGDLLDTLNEYADDFGEMGLTGDQFLSMLNRGLEAGAYNTDKLADAINEFGVRIRDPAIGDKVRAIDSGIAGIYDEFQSGAITEAEALDGMLKRISAIEDPIKRNAAGVELFGSMWEDLGEKPILAMQGLKESTIATAGATESLNAQYAGWQNMWEGLKRKALLALEPLGEALLELASQIMPYVEAAFEKITAWWEDTGQEAFGLFKQAILDLFAGDTEAAWNNLMAAIDLVFGEGTSDKIEKFRDKLEEVISKIKIFAAKVILKFNEIWDEIQIWWTQNIKETWDKVVYYLKNDFPEAFAVFKANVVLKLNEIWDEIQIWWTQNIKETWDKVIYYLRYEFLDALAVFRANWFLEFNTIWDNVQLWWHKNVKPLLDESKAWFEKDGPKIMTPYVAAWVVLSETAKSVATVFKDSVWPPIRDALKALGEAFGVLGGDADNFGMKLDLVGTAVTFVTQVVIDLVVGPLVLLAAVLAGLATGAANAFEAIIGTFLELGTSLEMILDGVVDLFTGLFDIIKGIITGDGELVQEGWSLLWTGLWEIISGTFETITTFLIGTVASLLELGTGFIEGFAGLFVELFEGLGIDVPNWLNNLVDAFHNIDWWGIGKSLIDGIKNGFTEGFSGFIDDTKNQINDLVNNLKGEAEIESPSGLTRREVGAPMGEGVIAGMADALADLPPLLSRSINRLGQEVDWLGIDRLTDAQQATTDAILKRQQETFKTLQGQVDARIAEQNARQRVSEAAGTVALAGAGDSYQVNLTVYADSQTNGEKVGEAAATAFLDSLRRKGGQT